jgi:hypothetical protein
MTPVNTLHFFSSLFSADYKKAVHHDIDSAVVHALVYALCRIDIEIRTSRSTSIKKL